MKVLRAKVEAIEIIVYGEKVLELDDSTWENIRKKRDYILKSTDWTVIPGCSVDQAQWSAYRQNLRDIPQTYKVITDVTWPTVNRLLLDLIVKKFPYLLSLK